MRNAFLAAACALATGSLLAQANINYVATADDHGNWWQFKSQNQVTTNGFFENYKSSLGFDANTSFILIKKERDPLDFTHYRYQQHYKNIKVEGAQFLLHEKNGLVEKANGRLVKGIQGNSIATLSFEEALKLAKAHTGATQFYWEMPQMEAWIKDQKNDPTATFYPKNELVWIDSEFAQNGDNYQLAYKFDLFFKATEDHKVFYLDAHTGALVWEEHQCHSGAANGTAHTRYHGQRSIITDSISVNHYELNDVTRGGGIETRNALQTTDVAASVPFTDSNNVWQNTIGGDDAATDAHWGAQMTYDYFMQMHGRNSYDGNGAKITSFVHWDSAWFNASWNGIAMRYGDGNGNPLLSIDIVGHELGHGVTGNSAALVYANESGALNESFSDIFGTAIEFYTLGGAADYEMGKLDFHLRNIHAPKSFGDPDTYFGINWFTGTGDNGGVHTNSGVQNYWFYLLCEGGTGNNDLGNSYQVDSFGIVKTTEIAYRNLNYYLTPSSDYYDSRRGSISAAEDIYGSCSYEANLIAQAWYAVGIGSDTLSQDVEILKINSPNNSCEIGSQEALEFTYTYHRSGCDSTIESGDTIWMGYNINNGTPVLEPMVAASRINSGDTLTYTFNSTANFSAAGSYNLNFWVAYSRDVMRENDSIFSHKINVLAPFTKTDSVTFETFSAAYENTIHNLIEGDNGKAFAHFQGKSTGFRGAVLTAEDADLFDLDIPADESEVFDKNPEFSAKVCMCVDASNMQHATLQFDLRQTYSGVYSFFLGPGANKIVSSLRVTVDGVQEGWIYHPTTTTQDTFVTQYVSLDRLVGQQFELCLEGKHFLSRAEDPSTTLGDNSYIDNILFGDFAFVDLGEENLASTKIFPNPTSGVVTVSWIDNNLEGVGLQVLNAKGEQVLSKDFSADGASQIQLDLSYLPKGIYLVQLQRGAGIYTEKITVH